jgi:hypothetical protein
MIKDQRILFFRIPTWEQLLMEASAAECAGRHPSLQLNQAIQFLVKGTDDDGRDGPCFIRPPPAINSPTAIDNDVHKFPHQDHNRTVVLMGQTVKIVKCEQRVRLVARKIPLRD